MTGLAVYASPKISEIVHLAGRGGRYRPLEGCRLKSLVSMVVVDG